MKKYYILPLLVALLGAGCAGFPAPDTETEEVVSPPQDVEVNLGEPPTYQPLCLRFSDDDGFTEWLNAYERGDENALLLSDGLGLPDQADAELLADIRESLNEDYVTRFFCVINSDADVFAWTADVVEEGSETCKAIMVTRTGDGNVTTADMETRQSKESCTELCVPKYQTKEKLVWQCDVYEEDGATKWSELHMERSDGSASMYGCVENENGITPGCVR